MNNIPLLENEALAEINKDQTFKLDDRSIAKQLEFFRQYCQRIPYGAKSWEDIFAAKGSLDKLAELYLNPEKADGLLPPLQTFLLAFYQLLENPKVLLNTLPILHKQLYYLDLLGVKPRAAIADHVILSFELDESTKELLLPAGTLFDGGQDDESNMLYYGLDNNLLANQSKLTDVYECQPDPNNPNTILTTVLINEETNTHIDEHGVRLFQIASEEQEKQIAINGRILSSPLLNLSSGKRKISLTFSKSLAPANIIEAKVSGGDSWLALSYSDSTTASTRIDFVLEENQAITPAQELDGLTSATPLFKLICDNGIEIPEVTKLTVEVIGATVAYSTDEGIATVEESSIPFGNLPALGSGFQLMSNDWCYLDNQKITISLSPVWMDLPDVTGGFKDWYKGYKTTVANNGVFKAKIFKIEDQKSTLLKEDSLFETTNPIKGKPVSFDLSNFSSTEIESNDPLDWSSRIRVELAGQHFLHEEYWQLVNTKPELNPPYTPQFESLRVDWQAETTISYDYIVTPFGYQTYSNKQTITEPQLYLGMSDIEVGQNINLYWVVEGVQPLTIEWQYLALDNNWKTFKDAVQDNSSGLFESAMWSTILPKDASNEALQMPEGRYWLRAKFEKISENSNGTSNYPILYGVYTNATTATLQSPEVVAENHFTQGLPANTITQAVEDIAGLLAVNQPRTSFGGRPKEKTEDFFARIGFRLAHRNRAITWRDMENLLLAKFPEILTVVTPVLAQGSCIAVTDKQTLIVVPRNGQAENTDKLKPAFNPANLKKMTAYLQSLASPWSAVEVNNPTYRDVMIKYNVSFSLDINVDYGYQALQKELIDYFMPWSQKGDQQISLANEIDYYEVIGFVGSRSYVTELKELTLDGKKQSVIAKTNEVLVFAWPTKQQVSSQTKKVATKKSKGANHG